MAAIGKKRGGTLARQNEAFDLLDVGGNWNVARAATKQPSSQAAAQPGTQALSGDVTPLGGEVEVSDVPTTQAAHAAIAALDGGGYVIAWADSTDSGARVIFGQRYDAGGNALGTNFIITDGDVQEDPSFQVTITRLAGGGFAVAWSELNPQSFQTGVGVQVQRYGADGSRLGNNVLVHDGGPDAGGDYTPTIVDLADGGFIVAYLAASGAILKGQRYNSSGSAVGTELDIGPAFAADDPSAARLADDKIVFAWSDGSGTSDGIVTRIFDPATGTFVAYGNAIIADASGLQQNPHVASLADGGYVVVWQSSGQDGDGFGIFGRRFSSDGTAVGSEFLVNEQTGDDQLDPSVVGLENGGFLVYWSSIDLDAGPAGDNDSKDVYARAFDASGVPGPEFLVSVSPQNEQETTNAGGPAVAQLANGDIVFTWEGEGQEDGAEHLGLGIWKRTFQLDDNATPTAVDDSPSTSENQAIDIAVLSNDSDGDGDTLTIIAVGTPAHGTATINPNGTIHYVPTPSYNGPDSFTYTVSDGNGGTDTATVNVSIGPVNDPPVAVDDAPVTDEDVPIDINVRANDTDADGDTLIVTNVSTASNGMVAINPDGTVRYTPAVNWFGTDTFTYTVSDGNGGSDTGSVSVTVNSVNDAPVAAADATLINENSVATLAVLANDSDIENDTLTVSAVGAAANGATAINSNGTVSYTPNANFFGTDSFTYTVSDGNGGTADATVTVTVNNIPEGTDDRGLTSEDMAVAIRVIANDVELDGDSLILSSVTQGAHGSVSIGAGGIVNYTPNLDFFGIDTFTYILSDGRGGSDTASVTVTVEEVVDDGELLVNQMLLGEQDEPTIAALADGGYVVVFKHYNLADVYARRFGADGLPAGNEFRVNTYTTSTQDDAVVTGLADGGFVVVWGSSGQDTGVNANGVLAVYGQRYDVAGAPVGGEFMVGTPSDQTRDRPAVAALEDGGFIVTLHFSNDDIFLQRYDAAGDPVGAFTNLTGTVSTNGDSSVAELAGGGWIVSYEDSSIGGDAGAGMWGRLYDAAGNSLGAQFLLNRSLDDAETNGSVAALAGGGFVAVWETDDDGDIAGIVARIFNADGSPAGDEFIVNTVTAGNQIRPSVTGLSSGGFVIDWMSSGQDGDTSGTSNVYARIYDAAGAAMSDPFLVNETLAGNQTLRGNIGSSIPHYSTIAELADGTLAFTWWGNGEGDDVAGSTEGGTYTRRFTADGLLVGTEGADTLESGKGHDVLQGLGGNDALSGMLGNDQLSGGDGDDLLLGGPGADIIDGGAGTDTASYASAPIGVTVSLALAGAQNTIGAGMDTLVDIENLTGSAWEDTLTGNGDANVLTGGGAGDVLDGGGGADVFVYLAAADSAAGGRDRIIGFESGVDRIDVSATGATSVAWLAVTDATGTYNLVSAQTASGGELNIRVDGNLTLADFILAEVAAQIGTPGNDILFGTGVGAVLRGLAGDDTYVVDDADDLVIEDLGEGFDVVFSSVSYALAAGQHVELLSASDSGATTPINLVGNELANIIYGNAGANVLVGGGGGDTLHGLAGNDTYYLYDPLSVAYESAGNGFDVIFSSVSYALGAGVHVELISAIDSFATTAINFVGNELANIIYGNAGANVLVGGGGGDTLHGLAGDDTYYLYDAQSFAYESAGNGFDVIFSSVSYALGAGVHVELISAIDSFATTAINFVGNELANIIYGNAGANVLAGGGGGDVLHGLAGDDTYYVYDPLSVAFESAGNGFDVIFSSVSYALGAGVHVELISAIDSAATNAIDFVGNELANIIYGNAGVNVLNGGLGADTLIGQGGSDSFAFTTALGSGNVDTIADFSALDDTIALDDAIFTGLAPGALNANAFVIGSAAQDADDRIVYNSATGQLFYDADGNGAGAAALFATLSGVPILSASDFSVI